jgi:hypothetical protein
MIYQTMLRDVERLFAVVLFGVLSVLVGKIESLILVVKSLLGDVNPSPTSDELLRHPLTINRECDIRTGKATICVRVGIWLTIFQCIELAAAYD